MVQVWKERIKERKRKRLREMGILATILTGAALVAVSHQMKKGRGKDESIFIA